MDEPNVIMLMEETIKKGKEMCVDFIVFGGMTLKEGKQKATFFKILNKHYPELIKPYQKLYTGSKWGEATHSYYHSINRTFNGIATKYRIPKRIPPAFYRDILNENDLVVVILEQIDYLLKLEGRKSPYGYGAYSISQLKEPLSERKGDLQKLKGIGKVTEGIILEILETGKSSYHEQLLRSST